MFRIINSKSKELLEFILAYEGIEKVIFEDGTNAMPREDGTVDYMFIENHAYLEAINAFNNRPAPTN